MGLQSACLACSGGGKPLVFGSAELPVAGGPVRPAGRRQFARSCAQWCRVRLRALSLRCARAFGMFGSGCLMHWCICCRACECESIYATVLTARAQLLVVKVKSIMLYYTCELTRPLIYDSIPTLLPSTCQSQERTVITGHERCTHQSTTRHAV